MTATRPLVETAVASPANDVPARVLTAADHARWAPIVRRTAMRIIRRAPAGFDVESLCRRGFVGLLDGLRQVDAMAPDLHDAYVEHRIRLAMIEHLRAARPAVRDARRASRDLARLLRRSAEAGGLPIGEADIAAGLGLGLEAYEEMLLAIADAGIARIDVLDLDDEAPDVAIPIACRTTLAQSIEELPLRERNVLGLLFCEDLSIDEAAGVLGASARRVRCLLTQAVHRLRAALGKE